MVVLFIMSWEMQGVAQAIAFNPTNPTFPPLTGYMYCNGMNPCTATSTIPWSVITGVPTGGGTGAVSSVFGRTGAISAQSGDYTAAQVTGAADLTAINTFQTLQTISFSGDSSSHFDMLSVLNPNLLIGNQNGVQIGTSKNTTNNSLFISFINTGGSGSASNSATFGLYNSPPIIIDGTGKTTIPSLAVSNLDGYVFCSASALCTASTTIPYSSLTGVPATGVSSVFGRTAAVTAQVGDYTAAQVTNAAATNVDNNFSVNQTVPSVTTRLIMGNGGTPSCIPGSGSGTSASCNVVGTGLSGVVTIVTGAGAGAGIELVTVNISPVALYPNFFSCVISNASSNNFNAPLNGEVGVTAVNSSSTFFTIYGGVIGSSTNYEFSYSCSGS